MIERINLLLKAKNITARQFAEEIGIQPSGMSHIMSGRNNPSLDFVMKVIKRWPEVNINWLMLGKGEMYGGVPLSVSPEEPHHSETLPPSSSNEQFDLFSQPEVKPHKPVVDAAENRDYVVPGSSSNNMSIPTPSPIPREQTNVVPASSTNESVSSHAVAESEKGQPFENRLNDPSLGIPPIKPNVNAKKIVKIIVFYEDHSFSEYSPE
ncbi:MAG: helix-turn-helix transcriptional regulator [Bacteroidales bacterium]|nr:helix-turn-helix transcriptional regulator [Bacteroidales bacterium]